MVSGLGRPGRPANRRQIVGKSMTEAGRPEKTEIDYCPENYGHGDQRGWRRDRLNEGRENLRKKFTR